MVIERLIALLVAVILSFVAGMSLSKDRWSKKVFALLKENDQLKKELAKKTEQIQYWEATPETTITG